MDIQMDGDVELQIGPVKVRYTQKKPEETKGLGFTKDHLVVAHLTRLLSRLQEYLPALPTGVRDEAEALGRLLREMGLARE